MTVTTTAATDGAQPQPSPQYSNLAVRFRKASILGSVTSILSWDTATMMPTGSGEGRATQMALLRKMQHELIAAPDVADWLDGAEATQADLSTWEQANLREMRRSWIHAASLPADLVAAQSRASSTCFAAWRIAKPKSDFDAVREPLKEVVRRARDIAAAKAEHLGCTPYDALLDEYVPGVKSADINPIFAKLAARLPDLIDRAAGRDRKKLSPGHYPEVAQKALATRCMKALGFDFERGRLDTSMHPFCGGNPDDVRITTRYRLEDFTGSLMGTLHETGHALYEAGLPTEWEHQPVGTAAGMAIHESQSLLVEMQVCRSRPFIEFLGTLLPEAFDNSSDLTVQRLVEHYQHVERSPIRVDADELTYPTHVILRYELEQQLIDGTVTVDDLPDAFAQGMAKTVGLAPKTLAEGCMQDVHWFDGAFGYFPSYTLGAMAAAQFFATAKEQLKDLDGQIGRGDFGPLRDWLRANIHTQASLLPGLDLVESVTGSPLDPERYLKHLETRYLA